MPEEYRYMDTYLCIHCQYVHVTLFILIHFCKYKIIVPFFADLLLQKY